MKVLHLILSVVPFLTFTQVSARQSSSDISVRYAAIIVTHRYSTIFKQRFRKYISNVKNLGSLGKKNYSLKSFKLGLVAKKLNVDCYIVFENALTSYDIYKNVKLLNKSECVINDQTLDKTVVGFKRKNRSRAQRIRSKNRKIKQRQNIIVLINSRKDTMLLAQERNRAKKVYNSTSRNEERNEENNAPKKKYYSQINNNPKNSYNFTPGRRDNSIKSKMGYNAIPGNQGNSKPNKGYITTPSSQGNGNPNKGYNTITGNQGNSNPNKGCITTPSSQGNGNP
ncbi:circumsporozoite protein-like [Diaphorina citri]|uniref:Circumsporozoite protein-like n=1 Tax=Diaphorina citri TaxID=121845 RepID=A0A3Q0JBA8_DIACI|nr:circumsporozoite protein-like [Diaphorina citri]